MRIVCPSCAAAYDVPEPRLTPGRTVRCARCGEEWAPVAHSAPPSDRALAPAATPSAPPSRSPNTLSQPEPVQRKHVATAGQPHGQPLWRGGLLLLLAWAGTVAILAGLAWGAYGWRADVMRLWPPSERAYAILGLGWPPK